MPSGSGVAKLRPSIIPASSASAAVRLGSRGAAGRVEAVGGHWSTGHNIGVFGRQMVARARKLGHTLRPSGEWR